MIGERLQELRKDHGMSQLELARKIHVSFHTVSSYERDRSMPNDEIKLKIAKLFDVSLDFLLGLIDVPLSYNREPNCLPLPRDFSEQEVEQVRNYVEFLTFQREKGREKTRKSGETR